MKKSNLHNFLYNIVKVGVYVDTTLMRLSKTDYYADSVIDIEEIIKKDFINIIYKEMSKTNKSKGYSEEYNGLLMDEEVDTLLINIKKSLFIRVKEICLAKQPKKKLIK